MDKWAYHAYLWLGRSILNGCLWLSLIRCVRQFKRANATWLNDLLWSSYVPNLINLPLNKITKCI